jgi:hypothetical protein
MCTVLLSLRVNPISVNNNNNNNNNSLLSAPLTGYSLPCTNIFHTTHYPIYCLQYTINHKITHFCVLFNYVFFFLRTAILYTVTGNVTLPVRRGHSCGQKAITGVRSSVYRPAGRPPSARANVRNMAQRNG